MAHRGLVVLAATVALASSSCAYLARVNVTSQEVGASLPATQFYDVSADGRFVAFATDAPLSPGDANETTDVYVRDTFAGTTERVSPDPGALDPAISGSGRYVAFGFVADIAVHDRQLGTMTVLDVSGMSCGFGPATGYPNHPKLSDDGRHVVFQGTCTPNPGENWAAQFSLDRQTGAVRCVSCRANGTAGPTDSRSAEISRDGRYIAFESNDDLLVAGDGNDTRDVFVRDRDTDADGTFDEVGSTSLVRVSVASDETESNGFSQVGGPPTGAGRFMVFESQADNLVPGAAGHHVYRRDLLLGTTALVSATANGTPADGGAAIVNTNETDHRRAASDDGRFVTFRSAATNLGPGGQLSAYVKDMVTGIVQRVSTSVLLAAAPTGVTVSSLSGDGRYVVFLTDSSLENTDQNGFSDLYLRSAVSPQFTGAVPTTIARGTAAQVVLTGGGFFDLPGVPTVTIDPAAGITVSGVTVLGPTQLRVTFSVAADAATGGRTIAVRNQGTGPGPSTGSIGFCACVTIT